MKTEDEVAHSSRSPSKFHLCTETGQPRSDVSGERSPGSKCDSSRRLPDGHTDLAVVLIQIRRSPTLQRANPHIARTVVMFRSVINRASSRL